MSELESGSDSESDERSKYTSKKGDKSADKECKAKHRHSKHLSELVKSKHHLSREVLSNKKKYSHVCHLSKGLHIDRNCQSKHQHKSDDDSASSESNESETRKSHRLKGGKCDKKSSRKEVTTSTKKPQDCLDFNFDFYKYKYSLGKIFFKDVYFSKISDK